MIPLSPQEAFSTAILSEDKKEESSSKEPAQPKTLSSKSVFSHPETHPVCLDMILLKNFETDWFYWLPSTLFREIELTFNTSIAEINKIKIAAVQTLHVSSVFWDQWELFEKIIWSLNGVIPLVNSVQPPDLPILYSGVDIANTIRKEEFGEEVARYCTAVFLHENVHYAPAPLDFCQKYLSEPMYTCKDCGKKASAIPPAFDGYCTSCAGHFDKEHPFTFTPDAEIVKNGSGKNITIENTFDFRPIQKRFEILDKTSSSTIANEIKEASEDIQAAKLITAVDFLKHRTKQLKDQMLSIRNWLETS